METLIKEKRTTLSTALLLCVKSPRISPHKSPHILLNNQRGGITSISLKRQYKPDKLFFIIFNSYIKHPTFH